MSGYEEQELIAIDAALDANPDATSNEVFQATRPYDERAIASVAASRALAGGGGSMPSDLGRAIYDVSFAATGVSNNTSTALDIGTLSSGDALLDVADPTRPTLVTAGVYAVSGTVNLVEAANTDCQVRVEMEMDADGEDADFLIFGIASAGKGFYLTVTATYYIPAGGSISLTAKHFDDISHGFGSNLVIQRVA